jgi:replicative DNA helicase
VGEIVNDMGDVISEQGWQCRLKPVTVFSERGGRDYLISAPGGVNEMTVLLRKHNVMGKRSIEKTIPDAIFSLPNAQLALFIGRLWSCDGSVDARGNVNYSTGSRKIADELQHLLLRFGVTSRVRTLTRKIKEGSEDRNYYEVLVHKEHVERFKSTVGVHVIGPKAKRLKRAEFHGRSRVGWIRNEELWDEIRAEMEERPHLVSQIGDKLGYEFRFQKSHVLDHSSGRIRRRLFAAFCEVYDSPLKWVLDENIQWDEIVSIEDAGELPCYDLSVPETECFIADDMVTHNTWILLKWFQHILRHDLKPGQNLLIASMEMAPSQMYRRLAAIDLYLDYANFRAGRLTVEEEKRLKEWEEAMRDGDDSQPTICVAGADVIRNVGDICDKVAELGSCLVGLDGLYILGRDSKKSMWERTIDNISDLKLELCAGMNMGCLATSQFRGSKNKNELKADADDAAYAKAIGDWADAMRGLFMNDDYEKNKRRVFRYMESREFRGVDLQINFDLDRMDFSEDHVMGEKTEEKEPIADDTPEMKEIAELPAVITGKPEDTSEPPPPKTPIDF